MVLTRQSSNNNNNNGEGHTESVSRSSRSLLPTFEHQPSTSTAHVQIINLVDLPQEIIEKIFSYIGYKTVAHLRVVSKKMDFVCSQVLNGTFQRLQNQMLTRFQAIKSMMPRRESARRNHPLACESDIIETLHMRLTLLQMTFGKHIERKHCCFFAGEILDEVYRILNYIHVTAPKLARPYKVTDELFDLSTMAMEYFKEYIEPTLPEIGYFRPDFFRCNFTGAKFEQLWQDSSNSFEESISSSSNGNLDRSYRVDVDYSQPEFPPQPNMVLRKRIRKIKQGMKRYNCQLSFLRRELRSCKSKMAEQQKQILEYATRLDENDKKNDETSRKFSTLLQELNKCKTELQYWRSKSPANPILCNTCGKVLVPAPTEDLQILANQGVVPEINPESDQVELLDLSLLPGTSSSQECSHLPMKRDQDVVACCSNISNVFSNSTSSNTSSAFSSNKKYEDFSSQIPNLEEEFKNKRKLTDDPMPPPSDYKKVRRISKGRSKRAKL